MPFACSERLPVSLPIFWRALPAMSFTWPLAWSLFIACSLAEDRPDRAVGLQIDAHAGSELVAVRVDVLQRAIVHAHGQAVERIAGPHGRHGARAAGGRGDVR